MAQGLDEFSELAQYELDRPSLRLLPEPFCRRNNVDYRVSVVPSPADRREQDRKASPGR